METKGAPFRGTTPVRRALARRSWNAITGATVSAYSSFSRSTPRRPSAASAARGFHPPASLLCQLARAYSSCSSSLILL